MATEWLYIKSDVIDEVCLGYVVDDPFCMNRMPNLPSDFQVLPQDNFVAVFSNVGRLQRGRASWIRPQGRSKSSLENPRHGNHVTLTLGHT